MPSIEQETSPPLHHMKLIDSMRTAMCVSSLVYLYADMRLLSATGYMVTPFELLKVASDRIGEGRSDEEPKALRPSQIWCVLLAELRREAAHKQQQQTGNSGVFPDLHSAAPLMYRDDARASANQHDPSYDLIRAIEDMVMHDLKPSDMKIGDMHCPDTTSGACILQHFGLHHSQFLMDLVLHEAKKRLLSPLPSKLTAEKRDELLDLFEDALQSPDSPTIELLCSQFKDDSLTKSILESKYEVIWFQDQYPMKDIVFGVALDRGTKSMFVVFRGTVTPDDWSHNLDVKVALVKNPIQEEYEGKSPVVDVYRGYQTYLLRERRDTLQTWASKLIGDIGDYGKRFLDDNYQVFVFGHSMGGALATLFGFFASADSNITKHHPVVVYSFASPMTGGHLFADAFRHQEKQGKIRHARIANGLDMVAHLPPNVKITKRGTRFTHVGMGVQLRRPPRRFFSPYFLFKVPRRPVVRYGKKRGFWSSLRRAYRDSFLLNMAPLNMGRYHGLFEYNDRANYVKTCEFGLFDLSLEEFYDMYAKPTW